MYSVTSIRVLYPCIQALLEVVNDLFEEQTDLEKIVKKIMHRAQTLLKCERCSVLLLEDIESPVSIPVPLVEGLIYELCSSFFCTVEKLFHIECKHWIARILSAYNSNASCIQVPLSSTCLKGN